MIIYLSIIYITVNVYFIFINSSASFFNSSEATIGPLPEEIQPSYFSNQNSFPLKTCFQIPCFKFSVPCIGTSFMCAWSIPVPSIINPTLPTSSKCFSRIPATFLAAIINFPKTSSGNFRTSLPKCFLGTTQVNPFVFGSIERKAMNFSSSQNMPGVVIFLVVIPQKIHLLSFAVASYFAILMFYYTNFNFSGYIFFIFYDYPNNNSNGLNLSRR